MYFAKCVFPIIFNQIDIRTSASVVSNDTRADEATAKVHPCVADIMCIRYEIHTPALTYFAENILVLLRIYENSVRVLVAYFLIRTQTDETKYAYFLVLR